MALSILSGTRGTEFSCDSEHGTRDHERIKSWFRSNVRGLFGAVSVYGRRIKEMIQLQLEQA